MQPRNTPGTPLPRRHARRTFSVAALGVVALTALAAACADAPTAPRTAAPHDRPALATTSTTSTTSSSTVAALVRDVPLASTLTRTWTLKRSSGGTLEWPEVGLRVSVPANAFSAREMQFTVTALKGDVVAYDFGPDGSQFAVPLLVIQSLKGTNYYKSTTPLTLEGAYFKSATQINGTTKTATVNEFQPTELDLSTSQVKFKVTHFSGYMVSTGRIDDGGF